MAIRFHRKESVANGIRRLLGEQTGLLVSLLADRGGGSAERIHEARVELKRMRAVLHLARGGLDAEFFATENVSLRDLGRKLARAREAQVCLTVYDSLMEKQPPHEGVRQLLEEDAKRKQRRVARPAQLAGIAATLRTSGHALSLARMEVDDWPLLAPALHASYRKARKLRQIAKDPAREAELHESRKRVKRLYYQLETLRRALCKTVRRCLPRLRKLSDLLGEHHDLCALRGTLREFAAHGVTAAKSAELEKHLAKRLDQLLRKIRKQAKAAFDERPKDFMKLVHTSWRRWRLGETVE